MSDFSHCDDHDKCIGEIKENTSSIVVKFDEFKDEVIKFMAGLEQWQEQTTEYRKSLCIKVDNIKDKVSELPCKEAETKYSGLNRQVKFMWGAFAVTILVLVWDIFKFHSK